VTVWEPRGYGSDTRTGILFRGRHDERYPPDATDDADVVLTPASDNDVALVDHLTRVGVADLCAGPGWFVLDGRSRSTRRGGGCAVGGREAPDWSSMFLVAFFASLVLRRRAKRA